MSNTQAPTAQPLAEANLYSLAGGGLHVTYSTTGIDGQPHLTYQDPQRSLSFRGGQIRVTAVPDLGTVASVTLVQVPDLGTTSFSLLLPAVRLEAATAASPVPVSTKGITTHHRTSIAPGLNQGQQDFYSVVTLRGSASRVAF